MTPPPSRCDVTVVGGGSAGLAAALAYARTGLSVCLLEKQPEGHAPPRGEIIQPNGIAALHRLGVLPRVKSLPHAVTDTYRFMRIGSGPLCAFDYGELDHPFPTTLVLLPETIRTALEEALGQHPGYASHQAGVTGLIRESGTVSGVTWRQGEQTGRIRANLVVGADGAFSKVRREMNTGQRISLYPGGYLTGLVPRPDGFENDGYYYLGKGEILGLFPVSEEQLYFFYLLPVDGISRYREMGVDWLQNRIAEIHPGAGEAVKAIRGWNDLNFYPCNLVMATRWYAPGAALVGDAAHNVNPHVAQGRNLAMVDALELARRTTPALLEGRAPTPADLHGYERARRPQAEALQRLSDELVLFWNAKNPALMMLRDAAFRGLKRHTHLRYRVTAEIAGLESAPLGPLERARLVVA